MLGDFLFIFRFFLLEKQYRVMAENVAIPPTGAPATELPSPPTEGATENIPSEAPNVRPKNENRIWIWIGATVGSLAVVVIAVILLWRIRIRREFF